MSERPVVVYLGDELAAYGFGDGHPFGPDRLAAFIRGYEALGLPQQVDEQPPVSAGREEIERFHENEYVEDVISKSATGSGFLDYGDTPAFPGVYEAAATVVGSSLAATHDLMEGRYRRAFVPIAGLHHASRTMAAGFCVFNDCGVVIETLFEQYGLQRVAYVDIDAHHGDGVFYAFESEPRLIFTDMHEDGRFLYPGTGALEEIGKGAAENLKMNVPLPPHTGDELFMQLWSSVEKFLMKHEPEFFILQCGADSLSGDPITHMELSKQAHAHVAGRLCMMADQLGHGRVLALGGGGYNRENIASGWAAVVKVMVDSS